MAVPFVHRAPAGPLFSAMIACTISAVELGSDAWFLAATNGKPPSADWIFPNDLSTVFRFGRLPHAASPCTASDVLLVSGPVNLAGFARTHEAFGFFRYACHSPFLHCCARATRCPPLTRGSFAFTRAALSAASARPCRNAPSKVGSCAPNRPLSGPDLRAVPIKRLTRLFFAAVPPKCRGSSASATDAMT